MLNLSTTNYGSLTDSTLATLSRKGEERAFEEITLRYIKLIYSISANYHMDGYEIQDFVQEGLLAFLIASKTFDGGSSASFKNYAVKCMKNRFNDIIKKGNAKGAVPKSQIVPMDELARETDDSQNVEDYVLEREYLKTITEHVHKTLTTDERLVFEMYTQGYSYKEIAEKTNSTPKSVDNLLQKIKRKLRKS